MARVVLVESFYGGSHRSWADRWIEQSAHDISLLSLPGEFWRWRLRGGAATLAQRFERHVCDNGRPDVVVCSSLIDVAAFAGHARRSLGPTPVALYLHESQLLYPRAPNQRLDDSTALVNWQSMLAADQVWFNSGYHRDALREHLPGLLANQPEPKQLELIDDALADSRVLWPGVHTADLVSNQRIAAVDDRGPRVLWNQRWDHDKNPRVIFGAFAALADEGIAFRLLMAGENQRHHDSGFEDLLHRLQHRIDHRGFVTPAHYRTLLSSSDVVASAASHEFFGMAIVEAIAAGAVPVLPNRLSFPELIEPQWHDAVLYDGPDLRSQLRSVLLDLPGARDRLVGLRESMVRFDVAPSGARHDDAVSELIASSR